jgi:DtxR family Mn-dependent transcriptional regulator
MSERVERKLLQILDHPTSSPYGNPIPGLAELGEVDGGEQFLGNGLRQLSELAGPTAAPVVVHRIGEPAQGDPEALAALRRAGLRPGERVQVRREGRRLLVAGADGQEADVEQRVAEHVFVTPA